VVRIAFLLNLVKRWEKDEKEYAEEKGKKKKRVMIINVGYSMIKILKLTLLL